MRSLCGRKRLPQRDLWRGVSPDVFVTRASAPPSMRVRTTAAFLCAAATESGVIPSMSRRRS